MRFQVSHLHKTTPELLLVTCISVFKSFDKRREDKTFYRKVTSNEFNLLLTYSRIQFWFVSVVHRKIWQLCSFNFYYSSHFVFILCFLLLSSFFFFFSIFFFPLFIQFSISFLSSSCVGDEKKHQEDGETSWLYVCHLLWYGDVFWDLNGCCV